MTIRRVKPKKKVELQTTLVYLLEATTQNITIARGFVNCCIDQLWLSPALEVNKNIRATQKLFSVQCIGKFCFAKSIFYFGARKCETKIREKLFLSSII